MSAPRTTHTFNTLYTALNKAQKEAVDAVEGAVMVVAGPGTGKTQILTLRIANILRVTDATANSILALTFTEAGVSAMRKRLVSIIGESGYKVAMYTFHGFCNEIIQRYPDEFGRIIGGEPITDVEQVVLLREIISGLSSKTLKPFGDTFYFLDTIKRKIDELKREGISPEQLRADIDAQKKAIEHADDLYHSKGAHKGKMKVVYQDALTHVHKGYELAVVYEQYEQKLRQKKLYDYADMLLEVLRELKQNETLLRRLQEEYQYILADEHQDANGAQNGILELLSDFHTDPNLFIVGDEKQAIFRFQGASLENFNYFKKKYPSAKLITLQNNYRSGQSILDGAHNLMEGNTLYNAPLVSHAGIAKSTITVAPFSHEQAELLWVARHIKNNIAEGVSPHEIAVLYRNNADADALRAVFEDEGIEHRIESTQNVLEDNDMRKLLIVLYAVAEYGSSIRLVPAMHLPFLGLSPTSVYRILRFARQERLGVFDVCTNKKHLKRAHVDINEVSACMQTLLSLAEHARKESVPTFFTRLVRESGFLTYILNARRAGELVEKLRSLANTISELSARDPNYTISTLVEHLHILEAYNIPITKGGGMMGVEGKVRLMTAHKAKGLEFDYVYIVGVRDTHWGNKRTRDLLPLPNLGNAKGENDDERRLMYVALTRARVGVFVSYSRLDTQGRDQLPSMFLDEIDASLKEVQDTTVFEQSLSAHDLFSVRREVTSAIHDKEFLNGLFNEFGLSVTALNNYLTCPWQYFYRNLVRIPEAPNKHLAFGDAVHSALLYFFEHATKKTRTAKTLVREFKKALSKKPLSSAEFTEALEKGTDALTGWYTQYREHMYFKTKNELDLQVVLAPEDSADAGVLLRGKLDKLELYEHTNTVVVDYKTGKPKSRNEIQGGTKNSNGEYYRQLVFYKLMLDLYNAEVERTGKGNSYTMTAGVVDFIEPDSKNIYHKESFDVSDESVQELKRDIRRVAHEIRELSFWNTRCEAYTKKPYGKSACEYCSLRDLMR